MNVTIGVRRAAPSTYLQRVDVVGSSDFDRVGLLTRNEDLHDDDLPNETRKYQKTTVSTATKTIHPNPLARANEPHKPH